LGHTITSGLGVFDAWTQIFSQAAVSFGLQPNQWEIKVQKIFNVFLTRFQLNAEGITRGEKIRDGAFEFDSLSGADFRPLNSRQVCQGVKNAFEIRYSFILPSLFPLIQTSAMRRKEKPRSASAPACQIGDSAMTPAAAYLERSNVSCYKTDRCAFH
jgi:hypothetical protein